MICSKLLIVTALDVDLPPAHAEVAGAPPREAEEGGGLRLSQVPPQGGGWPGGGPIVSCYSEIQRNTAGLGQSDLSVRLLNLE